LRELLFMLEGHGYDPRLTCPAASLSSNINSGEQCSPLPLVSLPDCSVQLSTKRYVTLTSVE
jgi:hypothetical protein